MRINKWGILAAGTALAAVVATPASAAPAPVEPFATSAPYVGPYDIKPGAVFGVHMSNNTIPWLKLGSDLRAEIRAANVKLPNAIATSNQIAPKAVDETDLSDAAKAKLNDKTGQVTGIEADGPYPGSTDLGKLKDQGDNSDETVPADNKVHTVWVQCAPGKTALSGGHRFGAVAEATQPDAEKPVIQDLYVQASQPAQAKDGKLIYAPIEGDEAGSFVPNAWAVEVVNTGSSAQTVRPFVTCANVAK